METSRDLSHVERLMLYQAWGKRCVWCKQPIGFSSLEIDHLVPKSLAGEELVQLLADYGLPASFDINALPNLVPSCRPCNGYKGNRPVRGAPLVIAILDKALERAPKIAERTAKFNRSRALDEVAALVKAIHPTADEMKPLNKLAQVDERLRLAACCYEPDPPKLKRSKNKLGYNGQSDKQQMFLMLENWVANHNIHALEVVQDTFDGGDTPPQEVWLTKVNSLAYAKEMGDFLANVKFSVSYLYITEDYSDLAEAEHDMNLWITLDHTKRIIVDVVADILLPTDTWQRL